MIIENMGIMIKVTSEEGFLLTDGETVTDVIFAKDESAIAGWSEIPNTDTMSENI